MRLVWAKTQHTCWGLNDVILVRTKCNGCRGLTSPISNEQLKRGTKVVPDGLAQRLFAVLGMGQKLAGENRGQ